MDPLSLITALAPAALGMASGQMTNYQNLQLAKLMNQFNAQQNQANRDLTYQMFRESMGFNSIEGQMNQYRRAGLSPYALLNGGATSSVSGQSAPSSIPMQAPVMQNPFNAESFLMGFSAINQMEEAESKSINNKYLARMLEHQLALLGIDVQKQELSLEVQQQTKDAQVTLQNVAAEREKFEQELRQKYGDSMSQYQLEQLIKTCELLEQQGLTEQNKRALNDIIGKTHMASIDQRNLELKIQQYLAKSQALLNEQTANLQKSQAQYQNQLTELSRRFGVYKEALNLANEWQNMGNTYQRSKMTQELTKSLMIKNKWMNRQEALDVVTKIVNNIQNITQIMHNIASLAQGMAGSSSAGMMYPPGTSTSLPILPMMLP